jgi:hypothetical protein
VKLPAKISPNCGEKDTGRGPARVGADGNHESTTSDCERRRNEQLPRENFPDPARTRRHIDHLRLGQRKEFDSAYLPDVAVQGQAPPRLDRGAAKSEYYYSAFFGGKWVRSAKTSTVKSFSAANPPGGVDAWWVTPKVTGDWSPPLAPLAKKNVKISLSR